MPFKETNIVRRMDEIGRIIIPKDIRKQCDINANELPFFEFLISKNGDILLKKCEIKLSE